MLPQRAQAFLIYLLKTSRLSSRLERGFGPFDVTVSGTQTRITDKPNSEREFGCEAPQPGHDRVCSFVVLDVLFHLPTTRHRAEN